MFLGLQLIVNSSLASPSLRISGEKQASNSKWRCCAKMCIQCFEEAPSRKAFLEEPLWPFTVICFFMFNSGGCGVG